MAAIWIGGFGKKNIRGVIHRSHGLFPYDLMMIQPIHAKLHILLNLCMDGPHIDQLMEGMHYKVMGERRRWQLPFPHPMSGVHHSIHHPSHLLHCKIPIHLKSKWIYIQDSHLKSAIKFPIFTPTSISMLINIMQEDI